MGVASPGVAKAVPNAMSRVHFYLPKGVPWGVPKFAFKLGLAVTGYVLCFVPCSILVTMIIHARSRSLTTKSGVLFGTVFM